MALDADQIGYFITQVGLAAASFGVAKNDVMAVGTALTTLFAYKCSAPAVVVPAQGPQLESICTDTSCPLDPKNATCGLYDNMNGASPHPAVASGSASAAAPTPTTMKTVVMSSTVIEYGQCPGPSSKMPSPAPTMAAAESMTPPASKSEMMSSAAPAPSSGCPPNLSGDYQFPHLIVPVSSEYKMMAYGTSFNGVINSTTSSIFNFDVPPSYQGSQCSLIFLFPQQSQLQTSRFTFSGNGAINFYGLGSPATPSTSYDNAPSVKVNIGTVTVAPGNSYTLANYPCPGGQRVAIKAMASGDTSLNYFQDYNPSPIGLYIRRC